MEGRYHALSVRSVTYSRSGCRPSTFGFVVCEHPTVLAGSSSSVCIRAAGQAHREHRALAGLARHGHVTAHHARELADDGEAETGAAEALRGRGIGLAEFLE